MSPQGPSTVLEWSIVFGAIAWIGRQAAEYFRAKERSEGNLIRSLIDDLRTTQKDLIEELKNGQLEVLKQISMESALSEISTLTRTDLQRALGSQAGMYAELMDRVSKLDQKMDALHRRFDEVSDIEFRSDQRVAQAKRLYPGSTSDLG